MNLFSSENINTKIKLSLIDSDITYYPTLFDSEEATEIFEQLLTETTWQQDDISLFGKTYKQPRLTALFSENNKVYSYSGITMFPKPFTPTLQKIKSTIESKINSLQKTQYESKFNVVLLNLYRNGNDSIGWHSDDEKELGINPEIASVSFGSERIFQLKHKTNKSLQTKILLEHGSLLLMKGKTQHFWQHRISKSKKINQPRINLTFRFIK